MKLLLGGGTAGHINPALAIAGYVCQRSRPRRSSTWEPRAAWRRDWFLRRAMILRRSRFQAFKKLSFESLKKCPYRKAGVLIQQRGKKIISRFQPDLCIGTGGYVSGPVIRQAQKMGIPTLIHEQNAFPGVTNKMLSKHATG